MSQLIWVKDLVGGLVNSLWKLEIVILIEILTYVHCTLIASIFFKGITNPRSQSCVKKARENASIMDGMKVFPISGIDPGPNDDWLACY